MAELIASGRVVDLIIFVIVIEFFWLTVGRSWKAIDAALRLGPGVMMLLALRGALTGSDWQWVALTLALSFPLHLADLARTPLRPGGDRRRDY